MSPSREFGSTRGVSTMIVHATDTFTASKKAKTCHGSVRIAFQPIVNIRNASVWGYEALTRGPEGESYPAMIAGKSERQRASFDRLTIAKAMREAGRLGLMRHGARLTLNVRPTMSPDAADANFVARLAEHYGLPKKRVVLELTEDAKLTCDDFLEVMELHRKVGIATAIDDFGAGYSGLNVLATCAADLVKLDQHLVRGIDQDPKRQIIVEAFARVCSEFGSTVVAEGVETESEARVLRRLGIDLMQGYYFARPAVGVQRVARMRIGENAFLKAWRWSADRWAAASRITA